MIVKSILTKNRSIEFNCVNEDDSENKICFQMLSAYMDAIVCPDSLTKRGPDAKMKIEN